MRFLIAVIDSNTNTASGDEIQAIDAFNDMLSANGHMIMACGITAPSEAVVLDNRADRGFVSEGPLNATDEYMAGFWLINASSKQQALELAAAGSKACNRKVELRQLHG